MFKISIELISSKLKSIGELVSSRRLGKIVVISKSGEIIGKVREIRTKEFNVEGIIVAKPFSRYYEFIDKQSIKVFNQNEVLLKINPVTSLKGLSVYDTSGRRLGKVKKVMRSDNNNDFTSLVVKDKFYSKALLIEKDKIDIMKKNIILNIDYDEHFENSKKNKKNNK